MSDATSPADAGAEPIVDAIDKVAHALLDKVLGKTAALLDAGSGSSEAVLRDNLLERFAEALVRHFVAHLQAALPAGPPPPFIDATRNPAPSTSETFAIEEAAAMDRMTEAVIQKVMSKVDPLLTELAKLVPGQSGAPNDLLASALKMQKAAAEKALLGLNDRVLAAQQRYAQPRR